MDNINLDVVWILLYALFFAIAAFRANQLQWFWASVFLWVGVSFLGAQLMPGVWGITHIGPVYLIHFYVTIASVFFFANSCSRIADSRLWQLGQNEWLGLFAVSNLAMFISEFMLALLIWIQYPSGLTAFALPAWLEITVLKPRYWFLLQLFMMCIFYIHRRGIMKQPAYLFSVKQIKAGVLLALIIQSITMLKVMLEIHY